ncbi:hypothetical protein RT717_11230 [Imperialibacter roseus]|uniref:Uncharacterized protein n=1 Tax=Imperialibacter roseus TaxID=1324217 RepID=A0ABZ0IYJ9_9BACT|nr:hypothetical protein [Imperialibacter roseus]WOK09209.1 hypothetical protein RT717_11230 [Imperialibacter roseus]
MNEAEINELKLRLKGMSESKMDVIIEKIKPLVSKGFTPQEIFPMGIRVQPEEKVEDAVISFLTRPGQEHNSLLQQLSDGGLTEARVFTVGIIRDDFMRTEVTLKGR